MACLRPISATQNSEGTVQLRESRLSATLEDGQYLELPCGTCGACRTAKARDWAIRSHHEAQTTTRREAGGDVSTGCFITLTYENLPLNSSLDLEHWQEFVRKLRRAVGRIRFLHCGEYGPLTQRPHYHALLFGHDFRADRKIFKTQDDRDTFSSEHLAELWGRGFCTLTPINFYTAKYVAGYVIKKMKDTEWAIDHDVYADTGDPLYRIKPPYITMSKKPGLGSDWIRKFWPDVYPRDQVIIGGRAYRPPSFYDDYIREAKPIIWEQVLVKRQEFLDTLDPTSNITLRARNEIFKARFNMTTPRQEH